MLLGTYQEIPNINGKPCNFNEVERKFNNQLGFAPMWFFPITSMKDFYMQSISTAPNAPQILLIIDTDNYVRINKIKHYQNLKEDISDLTDAIDENNEDKYSEFCVNPDEVVRDGVIKEIICLIEIEKFMRGDNITCFFPGLQNVPNDVQAEFRRACNSIPEPIVDIPDIAGVAINKHDFEIRAKCEYFKMIFESVFLPFAYNFANGKSVKSFYFEACLYNCFKLTSYKNKFSFWSYEDCSKEGFDKLYEEAKPYIIESEELLIAILDNRLPGRNDTCLCGSGLKFKKCCGRYV